MANEGHKIPTKIKKLRGTVRSDRVLEDELEFTPLDHIPQPPDFLGKEGIEVWYEVLSEYTEIEVFSKLDLPCLAAYCKAWEDYVKHSEFINANGDVYCEKIAIKVNGEKVLVDGNPKYRPEARLKKESAESMLKFATQFGLTLKARSTIQNKNSKEKEIDPFEQMYGATG